MIYLIQPDSKVPPGIFGDYLRGAARPHRLIRLDVGDPLPGIGEEDIFLLFGGYMGVHDEAGYSFLRQLKVFLRQAVNAKTPVLGICLGGQLLAEVLSGRVTPHCREEKGLCPVTLTPEGRADPLFAGVPTTFAAFQWHNDSFDLPPGAKHLARSAVCPFQAFRYGNAWGIQFHPEVNAAIVASWSRRAGLPGRYLREFQAGESVSRKISLQLLANFLTLFRN